MGWWGNDAFRRLEGVVAILTHAREHNLGEEVRCSIIPTLEDNYAYLVSWAGEALVVDPGEAAPVLAELKKSKLSLKCILLTHHHQDHIGGVKEVKNTTQSALIGPDDARLGDLDRKVGDHEEVLLGPVAIEVVATPGHTASHLAYYVRDQKFLFSGDTLFAGGCGRLFEGTPKDMWESLQRLRALPDETLLYPGHEYTQHNLAFALSVEPHSQAIKARMAYVEKQRNDRKPTVPSTLGEEKKTNPFLRADDEKLQQALGMKGDDPVAVFTALRKAKDAF